MRGFSIAMSGGYSSCSVLASHLGGFSLAEPVSRFKGFNSCGARAQQFWLMGRLYSSGSLVVAQGHSCHEPGGIFPDQEWKPWQAGS